VGKVGSVTVPASCNPLPPPVGLRGAVGEPGLGLGAGLGAAAAGSTTLMLSVAWLSVAWAAAKKAAAAIRLRLTGRLQGGGRVGDDVGEPVRPEVAGVGGVGAGAVGAAVEAAMAGPGVVQQRRRVAVDVGHPLEQVDRDGGPSPVPGAR
jgi:hypothetical protein